MDSLHIVLVLYSVRTAKHSFLISVFVSWFNAFTVCNTIRIMKILSFAVLVKEIFECIGKHVISLHDIVVF